jgi:hypothetical protein
MEYLFSDTLSYWIGFVSLFTYLIISYFKNKTAELTIGIILFLSANSILPCLKVIYLMLYTEVITYDKIPYADRVYIIIGAIAIIWLSLSEILRKIKDQLS